MKEDKALNVAIVGGGPGSKAIMEMICAERLSQLRMKLVGVADTSPDAVGCQYARRKGIYTTNDYRDLYALEDLNLALEIDPERADALIFRASAYRRLDSLELAEENIARALAIAPRNPEALLERGNIRRLKGDREGARADWLAVIATGADAPEAAAARLNLERMDVKNP